MTLGQWGSSTSGFQKRDANHAEEYWEGLIAEIVWAGQLLYKVVLRKGDHISLVIVTLKDHG